MLLSKKIRQQIIDFIKEADKPVSVYSIDVNLDHSFLTVARDSHISPLMYFSKPNQTKEYLSVGAWNILTSIEVNNHLNSDCKDVRFFGLQAFSANEGEPSDFWLLPILWFEKQEHKTTLNVVVNKLSTPTNQIVDKVNNALNALTADVAGIEMPSFSQFTHLPNKEDWHILVADGKRTIKQGKIEKVVLARQTTFDFQANLNPFTLLIHVQNEDPGVYHFGIRFSSNESFIGGTPERLFEINNNHISSDALAGTLFKPHMANVNQLKQTLIKSKKNIGEHQYVVDFIFDKMKQLCTLDLKQAELPQVIELKYLLHLLVCFDGDLKPHVNWLDCLNALHPTPAVAGVPSLEALNFINHHEPFKRRWYAGPVGIVSSTDVQMLVAIRSGRVFDNKVALISGAGIVPQSDADDEWNELDAKINVFKSIFNGIGS
ncbi:MAG: isochorismate synthase [Candidatus Margulisiibacteriota bacterium]|nr:isochorismate synthase [Candidatus Margulisiibacteriota bacterium]